MADRTMTRRDSQRDDEAYAKAQETAFAGEHLLAYLTALVAIVLAAWGLLEGFGIVDIVDAGAATAANPAIEGSNAQTAFMDGILLLVPAATFAFLSLCFHASDHHRMRDVRSLDSKDKSAWAAEHAGAIAAGLAATALAVLGLLVGFDAFGSGYTAEDGILWSLASLVPAILSVTLHSVRHHQTSAERDVVIAMIEERIVSVPSTSGTRSPVDDRIR